MDDRRSGRARIGVTRWADMSQDKVEPYWKRVQEAGGDVIDLFGPESSTKGMSGLILTGGLDVQPARYGEAPHPTVKRVDPERDAFELDVLFGVLARDLPVLAICRGHQLQNVALGGKLLQHIEDGSHLAHLKTAGQPSRWHSLRLATRSTLHDVFAVDEMPVNSRHHQAVTPETLAPELEPTAWSPDGLVEGVESRDHRWVVGVQWHPERPELDHPAFAAASLRLFESFVRAASGVALRA